MEPKRESCDQPQRWASSAGQAHGKGLLRMQRGCTKVPLGAPRECHPPSAGTPEPWGHHARSPGSPSLLRGAAAGPAPAPLLGAPGALLTQKRDPQNTSIAAAGGTEPLLQAHAGQREKPAPALHGRAGARRARTSPPPARPRSLPGGSGRRHGLAPLPSPPRDGRRRPGLYRLGEAASGSPLYPLVSGRRCQVSSRGHGALGAERQAVLPVWGFLLCQGDFPVEISNP